MLPVLMGMVGLAVDLGMVYVSHTRLQNAVDAGAMAAT
jgi:Flp pilus assembly protein TadG